MKKKNIQCKTLADHTGSQAINNKQVKLTWLRTSSMLSFESSLKEQHQK